MEALEQSVLSSDLLAYEQCDCQIIEFIEDFISSLMN